MHMLIFLSIKPWPITPKGIQKISGWLWGARVAKLLMAEVYKI